MISRLFLLLALCSTASAHAAETYRNSIGMTFAHIPAGNFVMGNPQLDETAFELPDGDLKVIRDEAPPHEVRISRNFWLGTTEVTQEQWLRVMGTRPGPEALWKRKDWRMLPVVSVTWHEVQQFVRKLNALEKTSDYRLPTEAEWEYAARAGSRDARPFPKEAMDAHAWHLKNSNDEAQAVAGKKPNAWGLYDMLGNAWEWVADWYGPDYYAHSPSTDPNGPRSGEQRVRRGGSYHCELHLMRVNYRAADTPDTRYTVIGFRVLRQNVTAR